MKTKTQDNQAGERTQTWEHKGHSIEFMPSGKFRTVINGKAIFTPSIDSAKKKIDAALQAKPFEQFEALDIPYFGSLLGDDEADVEKLGDPFQVTGIQIEKRKRYFGDSVKFTIVSEKTNYYRDSNYRTVVAPNTPAARTLIERFNKMHAEAQKELFKIEAKLREAYEAIPRLEAGKFIESE